LSDTDAACASIALALRLIG